MPHTPSPAPTCARLQAYEARSGAAKKLETQRFGNVLLNGRATDAYADNFDLFRQLAGEQLSARLPNPNTDILFLWEIARQFGTSVHQMVRSPTIALAYAIRACKNSDFILHFKTANGVPVAGGVTNVILNGTHIEQSLSVTVMTSDHAEATFNINTARDTVLLPTALAFVMQ